MTHHTPRSSGEARQGVVEGDAFGEVVTVRSGFVRRLGRKDLPPDGPGLEYRTLIHTLIM